MPIYLTILKGRLGIDPDSEMITATTVTSGNTADVAAAEDLIGDLLGDHADTVNADADQADVAGQGDGWQPARRTPG